MSDTISLRYREGSSDKVYRARIEPKGDGFVVNFEYGRHGSALTAGSKTPSPVSRDQAQKVFDKLVAEKKGKGYTEAEGGQPYLGTENAGRDCGWRVQLLNAVDGDAELEQLLADPAWGLQEKWDGERRGLEWDGDSVIGVNRNGLFVPIAGEIADVVRTRLVVSGKTILDGEDFGTTFAPFDLLMLNGQDLRDRPYSERLELLEALIVEAVEMPRPHTHRSSERKRAALAQLRADNAEGAVFKRMDAPYRAGRPNSGGDARKFKFVESATTRVVGANAGKRSVGIELLDETTGLWVFVGNVTIPPNFAVPAEKQVVEVHYLYAMPASHALFQPVFGGVRRDMAASDCVLSQLKYKREGAPAQAAA